MLSIEVVNELRDKLRLGIAKTWNEENTKHAIIGVVLMQLGYDIFNPAEVDWESSPHIKGSRGERVDAAIYLGEKLPEFIIEVKAVNVNIDSSTIWYQVYNYYSFMRPKFAVLTNGVDWYFYSESKESNFMSESPYLKINLLNDSYDKIQELNKYAKDKLKDKSIDDILRISKYVDEFMNKLKTGTVPDYVIDKFMEYYKLDAKYRESVYIEFEHKLTTCHKSSEHKIVTGLSEEFVNKSIKFENMVDIYNLYMGKNYNKDYLKHVYIYDEPVEGIKSYNQLFRTAIIKIIDKMIANRDDICDEVEWNTKIAVCRGKVDSLMQSNNAIYNSDYDVTIRCEGSTDRIVGKLIDVLRVIGGMMGVISFDIEG